MKVTINRKQFVSVLKALKTLSDLGTDPRFTDVILLAARDNTLYISAGASAAFVSVALEADVQEKGMCHSTFKLYALAKAVKDEVITLSFNKKLSVSSDSGLRASLTETNKVIPIDVLAQKLAAGSVAELVLDAEEMSNLVEISNVFKPNTTIRWMEITSDGSAIYGSVAGSEYGSLEQLPMTGEGDACQFVLRPDQVAPILSFCGQRCKLSVVKDADGIYKITDPDNHTWWSAVQRVDK